MDTVDKDSLKILEIFKSLADPNPPIFILLLFNKIFLKIAKFK